MLHCGGDIKAQWQSGPEVAFRRGAAKWVMHYGRTGISFRVVSPGGVWAGADVVLEAPIDPELTIAFAKRVMHQMKVIPATADDPNAARRSPADAQRLLVPELSARWHASLQRTFFA